MDVMIATGRLDDFLRWELEMKKPADKKSAGSQIGGAHGGTRTPTPRGTWT